MLFHFTSLRYGMNWVVAALNCQFLRGVFNVDPIVLYLHGTSMVRLNFD